MKIKFFFSLILILLTLANPLLNAKTSWPNGRPKLVMVIVIDQFRADYLSRFKEKFSNDGFQALIENGAYFPYGEYDILQCMTGPGHATILTGAYPYQMGIPLNDWYDQEKKSEKYCVEDETFKIVGSNTKPHTGTSPKNLIATTVGDELKNSIEKARVYTLALKDRSAILLGGHRSDLSIWFDHNEKKWISSNYYLKNNELPKWIQKLNTDESLAKCELSKPCGIEITKVALEKLILEEKLGQSDGTDIVAVSLSSHDYAGHKLGPNAPEMIEMTLTEDRAIAQLRETLSKNIKGGLKNVLFVLTGDHGVANSPQYLKDTGIDSGYIDEKQLTNEIETLLTKKCGKAKDEKWIVDAVDFNFFINEKNLKSSKCELSKIEIEIKNYLLTQPEFVHVFTKDEYENKKLPPGMFARLIEKTYFKGRSGHVIGIQKPYYVTKSKNAASHMTGYTYDRTVPIIFSGFGIKPGVYADKAEVVDIAPTLSFILGILPPALSEGKVLKSALKE